MFSAGMQREKKQLKKQLLKELKNQLQFLPEDLPRHNSILWRAEIPVSEIDLFDWLRAQTAATKLYWSGRDHDFSMAGIGEAYVLTSQTGFDCESLFREIRGLVKNSPRNIKFYGGIRFDPSQEPASEWSNFLRYRFIVPQFELLRSGGEVVLAYNFGLQADEDGMIHQLEKAFDTMFFAKTPPPDSLEHYSHREDIPKWDDWEINIKKALSLFRKNELEKIVLAKKTTLTFDSPIDPVLLLKRLAQNSPTAFHFCFQVSQQSAFLGITPERLYRRDNGNIFSEALAGTRQRHEDPVVDEQLGADLLHSEKDLREHRSVSNMVKSSLDPFCDSIEVLSKESLLKLRHVQHLHTLYKGRLSNGVSDGELLARLHPTPAVGGYPRQKSISYISQMEPFDRGWYAGPVGWVNGTASEFAVAIRSALVSANKVSLYAGSGIVRGSDPQKEWEETENKILNFTRLFQHK